MKKLFIGALIALSAISFVACGNNTQSNNNSANTNDTVTTEVAQEDNSKAKEEAEAKEKAEKEAKEKAEAEKKAKEEEDRFNNAVTAAKIACNDNFTYSNVTGDYSTKTIHVNVGRDGVAQAMVVAKSTGMYMDEYYYMEDSLVGMCKTMQDSCGYHVQVNLINDANPDNTLLSILDGSVIYSYMNE